MFKILLVEDDMDICEIIRINLVNADYAVTLTHTKNEAIHAVENEKFDLILLDIMLPDGNGVELCAEIRKRVHSPIIFISCLDDDSTIIQALKMGGDDYLVKPFNLSILLARIDAHMRRVQMERRIAGQEHSLQIGNIKIGLDDHTIYKDNQAIYLSPIEFDILSYMFENPDRILSLEEIYQNVWNEPSVDDVRTVKVHVSNLRRKLEDDPVDPKHIKTIRRIGYLFHP